MIDDALRVCQARTGGEWIGCPPCGEYAHLEGWDVRTDHGEEPPTVIAEDQTPENAAYIALTTSPTIGYEVALRALKVLAPCLLCAACPVYEDCTQAVEDHPDECEASIIAWALKEAAHD